jgi:hypothetical protein
VIDPARHSPQPTDTPPTTLPDHAPPTTYHPAPRRRLPLTLRAWLVAACAATRLEVLAARLPGRTPR